MTTDDIKLLKNIEIDRFSEFCDFNDYVYSQYIDCTMYLIHRFYPSALINSCNGVYIIDYTKTVKRLLDNPYLLNSSYDVNYFVISANRNKPDLSRYDVHYIKNLTPKQAQNVIDANVAAFAQYNAALNEQNLINAINEI